MILNKRHPFVRVETPRDHTTKFLLMTTDCFFLELVASSYARWCKTKLHGVLIAAILIYQNVDGHTQEQIKQWRRLLIALQCLMIHFLVIWCTILCMDTQNKSPLYSVEVGATWIAAIVMDLIKLSWMTILRCLGAIHIMYGACLCSGIITPRVEQKLLMALL